MAKINVPVGNIPQLSPRLTGPYKVIKATGGNKFKIQHVRTGEVHVQHLDALKLTSMVLKEIITSKKNCRNTH